MWPRIKLKTKDSRMNISVNDYIQLFHFHSSIIGEQTITKTNPLFQLTFDRKSRDLNTNPDTSSATPSSTVSQSFGALKRSPHHNKQEEMFSTFQLLTLPVTRTQLILYIATFHTTFNVIRLSDKLYSRLQ
jgi:hypothetical protein